MYLTSIQSLTTLCSPVQGGEGEAQRLQSERCGQVAGVYHEGTPGDAVIEGASGRVRGCGCGVVR